MSGGVDFFFFFWINGGGDLVIMALGIDIPLLQMTLRFKSVGLDFEGQMLNER